MSLVYQAKICGPKKKHRKVLEINNGPKAIVILVFSFLSINKMSDIKLPISEAIKSIKITSSGPPNIMPSPIHSFTSPPPIHLPFEI